VNGWSSLVWGTGLMAGLFALTWTFARRVDNYSWVDVTWAFGLGFLGCFWLGNGGGFGVKQAGAGALLALWSVRLTWHLQQRIRRTHPHEDARYGVLREAWRGREGGAFFAFYQAQALSVVLLALPFWFIAVDPDHGWGLWETIGMVVSLLGIVGESVADAQMSRFKAKHACSTAVCNMGLWHYSRHPNYFFESVIWLGFYLFACGSQWGWTTIHSPCVIIFLLLKVTGIPPSEAASLLRRGPAYRAYQQSTSPFIPWPPKPEI